MVENDVRLETLRTIYSMSTPGDIFTVKEGLMLTHFDYSVSPSIEYFVDMKNYVDKPYERDRW